MTITPEAPSRARRIPLALLEALATPHAIDRYLELVHPMLTARELRGEVTEVTRSTANTVTLTVRPTRQWRGFHAGQFIRVSIEVEGVLRTRCYSPASSQHRPDGRIELTVKAHPDGLVSQYLHANARAGLVLGLSQAQGVFGLPDVRPDRVLLISGGSGITPVLSMLRTLCDENYAGDVVFLHYGYTEHDVAHLVELRELAARHDKVSLVLGYTDADDGDLRGFFSLEHLEQVAPWYADAKTFLCGPPGLMASVRSAFDEAGLAGQLSHEDFAPAFSAAPAADASGRIRFTASNLEVDNSGETLLAQAEAAGLNPEYGCRMGICFSCTKVKTSGCTQNVNTGEVDAESEVEIQLCISVPVGDVELAL